MRKRPGSTWNAGMAVAISVAVALTVLLPPSISAAEPMPGPTPTPPIPLLEPKSSPTPSPSPSPSKEADPSPQRPKPTHTGKVKDRRAVLHRVRKLGGLNRKQRQRKARVPRWVRDFQVGAGYSTRRIDELAMRLRALGVSGPAVDRLYDGLPIAGSSTWSDTWGAPRHEAGVLYRRHRGQDLFCERDAPVLAIEAGTIEFDVDRLGGQIARLHLGGGTYWYYAHLSRYNSGEVSSGERVEKGDEIGNCGTSGNAAGTPPHVHLGYYVFDVPADPLGELAARLGAAERRAQKLFRRASMERLVHAARFRTKRRFGDALIPRWAAQPDAVTTFLEVAGLGVNGRAERRGARLSRICYKPWLAVVRRASCIYPSSGRLPICGTTTPPPASRKCV